MLRPPSQRLDTQSEKACDHNDHDHYTDDVKNIHCLAPIATCATWKSA
jgi:hypothetical protein